MKKEHNFPKVNKQSTMLYMHHHQSNGISNVQPLGSTIGNNDKNSSSFCISAKTNDIVTGNKHTTHVIPQNKESNYYDQENKVSQSTMIESTLNS